jgi:hypothetical protein
MMLLEQIEQTIIRSTSFPIVMTSIGKDFHELRLDCDMQIRGKIPVIVRKHVGLDGQCDNWKITDDRFTSRECGAAWNEYYDEMVAIGSRNSVHEQSGELYAPIDTDPYTSLCCLLCAIIEIRVRAGLA